MRQHPDNDVHRQVLATARRYRRDGYRVALPERGDPLPGFLGDCMPDLVAERDDDRVVVQIKRADTVRGSNDIVALAKIIDRQPDWRFEFISVPAGRSIAIPDVAATRHEMRQLTGIGHTTAAFVLGCAMIEGLVTASAASYGVNPADLSLAQLARKLVVVGVISNEMRATVMDALATRDELVHRRDAQDLAPSKIDDLISLATRFLEEVEEAEAV